MLIKLIAIGTKMPSWIQIGFQEYAQRLPSGYSLALKEIATPKRAKGSDINQLIISEGHKLLAAATDPIIALDCQGQLWDTPQLAKQLQFWHDSNLNPSFLIGGPDGLSQDCLKKAKHRWSLSPLTFPHSLVRVVVAEQIYRAWSIINHHPYHRV
ncbi:MAG: 23S rRNA (pseudouridine(1915)-N(3))-methyltransferase RlmH [Proteobacteria bacterium]|nr:23S rRNA (pseudouridine(1915)-N(3))-methyltransferase RlmH [Pseudomonadota bacterium]